MRTLFPERSTEPSTTARSEEHTSELQSLRQLVCRLLLEKINVPLNGQGPVVESSGPSEFARSGPLLRRRHLLKCAFLLGIVLWAGWPHGAALAAVLIVQE